MPACFQLHRKTLPDTPVRFVDIDKELCDALGHECHPTRWLFGWYDDIGYWLATGRTWQEIRHDYQGRVLKAIADGDKGYEDFMRELVRILDYLEANYTHNHWREYSGFARG